MQLANMSLQLLFVDSRYFILLGGKQINGTKRECTRPAPSASSTFGDASNYPCKLIFGLSSSSSSEARQEPTSAGEKYDTNE
jgi:hypothetical protein